MAIQTRQCNTTSSSLEQIRFSVTIFPYNESTSSSFSFPSFINHHPWRTSSLSHQWRTHFLPLTISPSSILIKSLPLSYTLSTSSHLLLSGLPFCRTSARRTLLNRRRRTRLKSPLSDDEGDSGFFGGNDGSFYDGFGDGRDWNFGGSGNGGGGFNWNDFSFSPYLDDPAFNFVYEVVRWFVFSNCLHFAFQKVVRLVTEDREKVTLQIACVC